MADPNNPNNAQNQGQNTGQTDQDDDGTSKKMPTMGEFLSEIGQNLKNSFENVPKTASDIAQKVKSGAETVSDTAQKVKTGVDDAERKVFGFTGLDRLLAGEREQARQVPDKADLDAVQDANEYNKTRVKTPDGGWADAYNYGRDADGNRRIVSKDDQGLSDEERRRLDAIDYRDDPSAWKSQEALDEEYTQKVLAARDRICETTLFGVASASKELSKMSDTAFNGFQGFMTQFLNGSPMSTATSAYVGAIANVSAFGDTAVSIRNKVRKEYDLSPDIEWNAIKGTIRGEAYQKELESRTRAGIDAYNDMWRQLVGKSKPIGQWAFGTTPFTEAADPTGKLYGEFKTVFDSNISDDEKENIWKLIRDNSNFDLVLKQNSPEFQSAKTSLSSVLERDVDEKEALNILSPFCRDAYNGDVDPFKPESDLAGIRAMQFSTEDICDAARNIYAMKDILNKALSDDKSGRAPLTREERMAVQTKLDIVQDVSDNLRDEAQSIPELGEVYKVLDRKGAADKFEEAERERMAIEAWDTYSTGRKFFQPKYGSVYPGCAPVLRSDGTSFSGTSPPVWSRSAGTKLQAELSKYAPGSDEHNSLSNYGLAMTAGHEYYMIRDWATANGYLDTPEFKALSDSFVDYVNGLGLDDPAPTQHDAWSVSLDIDSGDGRPVPTAMSVSEWKSYVENRGARNQSSEPDVRALFGEQALQDDDLVLEFTADDRPVITKHWDFRNPDSKASRMLSDISSRLAGLSDTDPDFDNLTRQVRVLDSVRAAQFVDELVDRVIDTYSKKSSKLPPGLKNMDIESQRLRLRNWISEQIGVDPAELNANLSSLRGNGDFGGMSTLGTGGNNGYGGYDVFPDIPPGFDDDCSDADGVTDILLRSGVVDNWIGLTGKDGVAAQIDDPSLSPKMKLVARAKGEVLSAITRQLGRVNLPDSTRKVLEGLKTAIEDGSIVQVPGRLPWDADNDEFDLGEYLGMNPYSRALFRSRKTFSDEAVKIYLDAIARNFAGTITDRTMRALYAGNKSSGYSLKPGCGYVPGDGFSLGRLSMSNGSQSRALAIWAFTPVAEGGLGLSIEPGESRDDVADKIFRKLTDADDGLIYRYFSGKSLSRGARRATDQSSARFRADVLDAMNDINTRLTSTINSMRDVEAIANVVANYFYPHTKDGKRRKTATGKPAQSGFEKDMAAFKKDLITGLDKLYGDDIDGVKSAVNTILTAINEVGAEISTTSNTLSGKCGEIEVAVTGAASKLEAKVGEVGKDLGTSLNDVKDAVESDAGSPAVNVDLSGVMDRLDEIVRTTGDSGAIVGREDEILDLLRGLVANHGSAVLASAANATRPSAPRTVRAPARKKEPKVKLTRLNNLELGRTWMDGLHDSDSGLMDIDIVNELEGIIDNSGSARNPLIALECADGKSVPILIPRARNKGVLCLFGNSNNSAFKWGDDDGGTVDTTTIKSYGGMGVTAKYVYNLIHSNNDVLRTYGYAMLTAWRVFGEDKIPLTIPDPASGWAVDNPKLTFIAGAISSMYSRFSKMDRVPTRRERIQAALDWYDSSVAPFQDTDVDPADYVIQPSQSARDLVAEDAGEPREEEKAIEAVITPEDFPGKPESLADNSDPVKLANGLARLISEYPNVFKTEFDSELRRLGRTFDDDLNRKVVFTPTRDGWAVEEFDPDAEYGDKAVVCDMRTVYTMNRIARLAEGCKPLQTLGTKGANDSFRLGNISASAKSAVWEAIAQLIYANAGVERVRAEYEAEYISAAADLVRAMYAAAGIDAPDGDKLEEYARNISSYIQNSLDNIGTKQLGKYTNSMDEACKNLNNALDKLSKENADYAVDDEPMSFITRVVNDDNLGIYLPEVRDWVSRLDVNHSLSGRDVLDTGSFPYNLFSPDVGNDDGYAKAMLDSFNANLRKGGSESVPKENEGEYLKLFKGIAGLARLYQSYVDAKAKVGQGLSFQSSGNPLEDFRTLLRAYSSSPEGAGMIDVKDGFDLSSILPRIGIPSKTLDIGALANDAFWVGHSDLRMPLNIPSADILRDILLSKLPADAPDELRKKVSKAAGKVVGATSAGYYKHMNEVVGGEEDAADAIISEYLDPNEVVARLRPAMVGTPGLNSLGGGDVLAATSDLTTYSRMYSDILDLPIVTKKGFAKVQSMVSGLKGNYTEGTPEYAYFAWIQSNLGRLNTVIDTMADLKKSPVLGEVDDIANGAERLVAYGQEGTKDEKFRGGGDGKRVKLVSEPKSDEKKPKRKTKEDRAAERTNTALNNGVGVPNPNDLPLEQLLSPAEMDIFFSPKGELPTESNPVPVSIFDMAGANRGMGNGGMFNTLLSAVPASEKSGLLSSKKVKQSLDTSTISYIQGAINMIDGTMGYHPESKGTNYFLFRDYFAPVLGISPQTMASETISFEDIANLISASDWASKLGALVTTNKKHTTGFVPFKVESGGKKITYPVDIPLELVPSRCGKQPSAKDVSAYIGDALADSGLPDLLSEDGPVSSDGLLGSLKSLAGCGYSPADTLAKYLRLGTNWDDSGTFKESSVIAATDILMMMQPEALKKGATQDDIVEWVNKNYDSICALLGEDGASADLGISIEIATAAVERVASNLSKTTPPGIPEMGFAGDMMDVFGFLGGLSNWAIRTYYRKGVNPNEVDLRGYIVDTVGTNVDAIFAVDEDGKFTDRYQDILGSYLLMSGQYDKYDDLKNSLSTHNALHAAYNNAARIAMMVLGTGLTVLKASDGYEVPEKVRALSGFSLKGVEAEVGVNDEKTDGMKGADETGDEKTVETAPPLTKSASARAAQLERLKSLRGHR